MDKVDHDKMEQLFDEMSDRAYEKFDKMMDEALKDKSTTVVQLKTDPVPLVLYIIHAVCLLLLYILQIAAQSSLDAKIAKLDDRLDALERCLLERCFFEQSPEVKDVNDSHSDTDTL